MCEVTESFRYSAKHSLVADLVFAKGAPKSHSVLGLVSPVCARSDLSKNLLGLPSLEPVKGIRRRTPWVY